MVGQSFWRLTLLSSICLFTATDSFLFAITTPFMPLWITQCIDWLTKSLVQIAQGAQKHIIALFLCMLKTTAEHLNHFQTTDGYVSFYILRHCKKIIPFAQDEKAVQFAWLWARILWPNTTPFLHHIFLASNISANLLM